MSERECLVKKCKCGRVANYKSMCRRCYNLWRYHTFKRQILMQPSRQSSRKKIYSRRFRINRKAEKERRWLEARQSIGEF